MRDLPCSGSAVIMTAWHIHLNGGCAITRLCDNSSRFLTSAQSDRGMIRRHLYCKVDAADKPIRNRLSVFQGADLLVPRHPLPFRGADGRVATAPKRRNDIGVKPFVLGFWPMTSPLKRKWMSPNHEISPSKPRMAVGIAPTPRDLLPLLCERRFVPG